jgi:ABC-type sugar transport system permease subunit
MAQAVSFKALRNYWRLYFFVLPSVIMVALFAYFPAATAMYRAFFRWNGDYIKHFVGAANFQQALGRPSLWLLTLGLAIWLIAGSRRRTRWAEGSKWICGVGLPIVNLAVRWRLGAWWRAEGGGSALWLPVVFWGGTALLIGWLMDHEREARPGLLGAALLLGSVQFLAALGLRANVAWSLVLLAVGGYLNLHGNPSRRLGLRTSQALLALLLVVSTLADYAGGDRVLWNGAFVIAILVVANLFKMLPSIATAVVIHRLKSDRANYWYRVLFVVPMIIPGMVNLLIWKFFFEPDKVFNLILHRTGILGLLVRLDGWLDWGGVFQAGISPAWLNDTNLVLPAIIVWGFPWVGVVGVLIYLAGLQSIDASVYEAADLDGAGAFQKFLHIELPLILTQVRINLVLMIIGTLQMYGFILVLFGPEGGPNGKLMVPGLYMFRSAFTERYAGYACAIGIIIFVFILLLTELNNRFVRVEK